METTIWQKKKIIIYLGGDPSKNQVPEITVVLENPQIQLDTSKNTIIILETK